MNEWVFPHTIEGNQGTITYQGMTLRDYFAAHADMSGADDSWSLKECAKFLGVSEADYKWQIHWPMVIAKLRYQFADAMLAERAK